MPGAIQGDLFGMRITGRDCVNSAHIEGCKLPTRVLVVLGQSSGDSRTPNEPNLVVARDILSRGAVAA